MKFAAMFVALFTIGCSHGALEPTAPEKPKAQLEMSYAINVPVLADLQAFRGQFPDGVHLSPVAAQGRWDYTNAYGGTPNAYYGATAPPCPNFFNTGIIIAPYAAASKDLFTAADWPGIGLEAGLTYAWVGRFTYSIPAPASTYVIDLKCIH